MLDLFPINKYITTELKSHFLEVDKLCNIDLPNQLSNKKHKYLSYAENVILLNLAIQNKFIKAILISDQINLNEINSNNKLLIKSKNPKIAFFKLHNLQFNKSYQNNNIIDKSAKISNLSFIPDKGVVIEKNVLIEPFVTLYPGVTIKENSIIRSGSRIGADALEIKYHKNGKQLKCSHLGNVEIEKNVEIGPNSIVSRGLFNGQVTRIKSFSNIGSLTHISHGVVIGEKNFVAGGVEICGSSIIGNNNWIGPGAKISNQITIGSNCSITLGSIVLKNVSDNSKIIGSKIFNKKRLF